jgi:hypothetical protein
MTLLAKTAGRNSTFLKVSSISSVNSFPLGKNNSPIFLF